MRWLSSRQADAAALLALASLSPAAVALDCDNMEVDGHKFKFGKLAGPHSVVTTMFTPPTHKNTTYTVDICGALKRKGDVKKEDKCPDNTWICAIQRSLRQEHDDIEEVIPIAGELADQGGSALDYKATRLKSSESKADSQPEGVRLVLHGGLYRQHRQKAIIELVCNKTLEGTEGEWKSEDEYTSATLGRRDGEDKKENDAGNGLDDGAEHQLLKIPNPALVFTSYGADKTEENVEVLRLTWHTKYACESAVDDEQPVAGGSHWGFFTWFIVIVFTLTGAYLIFGSWLNYSRYGAQGWDLVPHGDTIRDVPYLLKDWIRRILNTLQGSGSRGGYAAV